MNGFAIGTVIEPAVEPIKTKDGKDRKKAAFGLLSGRTCTQYDVWDGDKNFDKVSLLKEGETAVVVFGVSVDDKGKIRTYLNGVGKCPRELRDTLQNLVKNDGTAKS